MTWVKLDDGFPDHPKVLAAGGAAAWLYVSGLCYCGRFLTDGFIPESVLPKLTDAPKPRDLASKLVSVGMWAPVDSGWKVHDYGQHQRTKAKVEAAREAAKERQSRKRHADSHAVTDEEVREPYIESSSSERASRSDRVERALTLLAEHDTHAFIDRGNKVNDYRAYVNGCLNARRRDHAADLHGFANANPEWTHFDLRDAVLTSEQPPATVAPLRAVKTTCDECGWNQETHEQPHVQVHAEWRAEESA